MHFREGDIYAAMCDCYKALEIDNMHLKSHFRLAKCLNELGWFADAKECLRIFSARFPSYARTNAFDNLLQEVDQNIRKSKEPSAHVHKKSKNNNKRHKPNLESFYRSRPGSSSSG